MAARGDGADAIGTENADHRTDGRVPVPWLPGSSQWGRPVRLTGQTGPFWTFAAFQSGGSRARSKSDRCGMWTNRRMVGKPFGSMLIDEEKIRPEAVG